MIYNLSILILFEFILAHSGVFMSYFGRSKWMLLLILFYGAFALVFNTLVNDNQILVLYGAVVLNRMVPGIQNRDEKEKARGVIISVFYAMTYFLLLFFFFFFSDKIPQLGLTDDFLSISKYNDITQASGLFLEEPHFAICFGALYYMMLTLWDLILIIRRVKKSFRHEK
jgi:hypothetical protein